MDIIGKGVGVEPGTRLVLSVKSPHLVNTSCLPVSITRSRSLPRRCNTPARSGLPTPPGDLPP